MSAVGKRIRVTLVKSPFGRLRTHRDSVRGLGLKRMHQSVELLATPEVLGMVRKTAFMLKIEELW
ncbi:MAG: 50S ribosomal protein L30 [Gammaproteobacteria bacterium]|nr:50S ribosomal protein L30 [Gammaproteobacteria bacterium]